MNEYCSQCKAVLAGNTATSHFFGTVICHRCCDIEREILTTYEIDERDALWMCGYLPKYGKRVATKRFTEKEFRWHYSIFWRRQTTLQA